LTDALTWLQQPESSVCLLLNICLWHLLISMPQPLATEGCPTPDRQTDAAVVVLLLVVVITLDCTASQHTCLPSTTSFPPSSVAYRELRNVTTVSSFPSYTNSLLFHNFNLQSSLLLLVFFLPCNACKLFQLPLRGKKLPQNYQIFLLLLQANQLASWQEFVHKLSTGM